MAITQHRLGLGSWNLAWKMLDIISLGPFFSFWKIQCFTPKTGVPAENVKNVSATIILDRLGLGTWNLVWGMFVRVSWHCFDFFFEISLFYPKIRKNVKNVFAAISQHRLGLGSSNLVWMVLIRVSRQFFSIFSKFHCFTPKKYGKTCLQPLQNLITKFYPTTCKALDLLNVMLECFGPEITNFLIYH